MTVQDTRGDSAASRFRMAQELLLANALEAMTSDRPYRAARSICEVREEIHSCSGTQFDPEVVKTFLSMPENIWEALRQEIAPQL